MRLQYGGPQDWWDALKTMQNLQRGLLQSAFAWFI